jgi:lysozyme family protein
VDADDIRRLTRERAIGLYHQLIWDATYDQLRDDAVALYIFDMDINMGEKRAHTIAQRAAVDLGASLVVDGKLGPKSVAALNALDPAALLARMRELRVAFYNDLVARKPALQVFQRGWLRRALA